MGNSDATTRFEKKPLTQFDSSPKDLDADYPPIHLAILWDTGKLRKHHLHISSLVHAAIQPSASNVLQVPAQGPQLVHAKR